MFSCSFLYFAVETWHCLDPVCIVQVNQNEIVQRRADKAVSFLCFELLTFADKFCIFSNQSNNVRHVAYNGPEIDRCKEGRD